MDEKDDIEIELKEDGVYLIINNYNYNYKKTKKIILKMIEKVKVKDVEVLAIDEFLKSKDKSSGEILISTNKDVNIHNETVDVYISKEELKATVIFKKEVNGKKLIYDDLLAAIDKNKVVYGVDYDELEKMFKNRKHDFEYTIAEGVEPINGENGYVEFYFPTAKIEIKPEILENGKVDYKNLNLVITKNKGDKLAKLFEPKEGKDGINVLGKPIAHKVGKANKLPSAGKNTELIEEENCIYALESGQVIFHNQKKIEILPVFIVERDVDSSTGNIKFNGSVVVKGMVRSDFFIEATGDIEIHGVVEGASITSENNISLYGGVQGLNKSFIKAKNDVFLKYGAYCNIEAGNNITSDSIMHSDVKCGGSITLEGENSVLVGGNIICKDSISAKVIGSRMGTKTDVVVLGLDVDMHSKFESYNELIVQFSKDKNKLLAMNNFIKNVTEELKKNSNDEAIQLKLLKAIKERERMKDELLKLQDEIKEITPDLTKGAEATSSKGVINVIDRVNPGVTIRIGNSTMKVYDTITTCKLKSEDSKIIIV